MEGPATLYTVGHSNVPVDKLLGTLLSAGIRTLVDIRRYPASRRHPHFNADSLARALGEAGITYHHAEALGGRRAPEANSPNTALRNPQFRGYADHMATQKFERALGEVLGLAASSPTAVMCAEAVPFKCHRFLLADAAVARGVRVLHLVGAIQRPHELSPAARVDEEGRVTYPALL